MLWIKPPLHKYFGALNNFVREQASIMMLNIAELREDMSALKMLKIWDPEDGTSFLAEQYRYTPEGLTKYWLSIDMAV